MKAWIQQKGLIPVFLFGFALYFLWDGVIGWPRSNQRWDAHERSEKFIALKEKPGEWEALCKENGWNTDAPPSWDSIRREKGWSDEVPHKRWARSDIIGQYVCASVAGAMGIFSLIFWLRAKKSRICSDADAVTTPSGKRVPYASITEVDLRKWESKGLAPIFYSLDRTKGRFVLDDAKYEPRALDAILKDIQEHTAGHAKVRQ